MRAARAAIRAYVALFSLLVSDSSHARDENRLIEWSVQESYDSKREAGISRWKALALALWEHLGEIQPVALYRKSVADQVSTPGTPGHGRAGMVAAGSALLFLLAAVSVGAAAQLLASEGVDHVAVDEAAAADASPEQPPQSATFGSHVSAVRSAGQDPSVVDSGEVGGLELADSEAATSPIEPTRHCWVRLNDVGASLGPTNPVCFDSIRDAIESATEGAVQLPPDATLTEVLEAEVLGVGVTVIGIDFTAPSFRGGSLSWVVGNADGCAGGLEFTSAAMPRGWDNVVSSAVALGGCREFRHYADGDLGEPTISCTCEAMHLINNRTSSVSWSR